MDTKRKLLRLIKGHEVLYNTELLEHKDNGSRIAAWNKISESMKMTVEDCKTEWARLRNCFVNALRRRVSLQNRGGKSLPPWLYESEMSFLKPFTTGRGWDDTPYTILLPDHTYEIDNDVTDMDSIKNDDSTKTKIKREKRYKKRQKIPKVEVDTYEILDSSNNGENILIDNDEYNINEPYNINDSYKAKNQSILGDMDESDLFFLGLSQTFKKLPKIEQCTLKMEIFKLLNDAEMRQLEGGGRKIVKRKSSSD